MLLVGMPCYGCQMHIDASQSLIEATNSGIPFQWVAIGNESLVPRARNNIFAYFYHNPAFTHLIFLDADMYLSGQDLKKLYESGKDVVGAAVRLKAKNTIYNFNSDELINGAPPTEGEELNDQNGNPTGGKYYKVDKLGTAVFMVSRKAATDMVILAKERGDVYGTSSILMGGPLSGGMPSEYYDVFRTGISKQDQKRYKKTGEPGLYLSEDYYFCKDLRDSGYSIYIDRTIQTRHNGMSEFNA